MLIVAVVAVVIVVVLVMIFLVLVLLVVSVVMPTLVMPTVPTVLAPVGVAGIVAVVAVGPVPVAAVGEGGPGDGVTVAGGQLRADQVARVDAGLRDPGRVPVIEGEAAHRDRAAVRVDQHAAHLGGAGPARSGAAGVVI